MLAALGGTMAHKRHKKYQIGSGIEEHRNARDAHIAVGAGPEASVAVGAGRIQRMLLRELVKEGAKGLVIELPWLDLKKQSRGGQNSMSFEILSGGGLTKLLRTSPVSAWNEKRAGKTKTGRDG